jgi:hypothetical protein
VVVFKECSKFVQNEAFLRTLEGIVNATMKSARLGVENKHAVPLWQREAVRRDLGSQENHQYYRFYVLRAAYTGPRVYNRSFKDG